MPDTRSLTPLPLPANVRIRRFTAPDDYAVLAAVYAASKPVDGLVRSRSPEEFAASYRTFGVDPEASAFIAEVDGEGVGYIVGSDDGVSPHLGHRLFHLGFVSPPWRRQGIGRELLRLAQARLLELAGSPDGPTWFVTIVFDTQRDAARLLEGSGYRPLRFTLHMVRPDLDDIPASELPAGISTRPVEAADVPAIVDAIDEAMRDEWNWTPMTAAQKMSIVDHPLFGQTDVWQVAWDGDQVVGGVLGWIDRDENEEYGRRRGYTEAIFVRRPWRGRGIAGALICQNLRLLRARGMQDAALGVDTENPSGALRLYQRHGFEVAFSEATFGRQVEAGGTA